MSKKAEKAKAMNPFTGETLSEYEFLSDEQIDKKIQESWNCFLRYRRSDPKERREKLMKLAGILEKDCDKFAKTITMEMGKPIKESKKEVQKAITECKYFAEHIDEFLKCDELESGEVKKSYVSYEPLGPIYHITPFNYPFYLQFRGTIAALAMGNTVLNKNPTTCPECGIMGEKAFREAGFDNGEYINLIISQDQSECVIKNKLVRGITFTGSTEGGSKIASLAGKYFKKNVMELGGSDPFIVLNDADLGKAIDQAVETRLQNAGQCCTSAKRFLIHEDIYDDFQKKLVEAVKKIKVGDPMDESTQVGPLAKKSGLEKIQEQLEKSKQQGGKIIYGGEPVSDEKLKKGWFFKPAIVEVTQDNPLFHEETFGPIFALTKFKSEEEAIKLANNTEFGLGGAIFTKDEAKAEKLAKEIESGILYINHMVDWEASNPGGQYNIILSVRSGTSVLNAAIADVNGNGWDFQGNFFDCIKDIIDFHQVRKRPVNITNQQATLDTPIRRKNWELRHRMIALGKELGSGSYGTVYRGVLTVERKHTTVAVKVLTEMSVEASNALWKEARVMMLYDHPNIVKMYGVANDFTPYYLVMELVDGGAVDRYLEKKGAKLSVKNRVNILVEAATGLEYLHSKGCIHRDIACRNLLISKVVKVADFGMTRRTSKYKVDPNKPMNLRWLAPEVYETAIVNKSTDVYAFGVTMYETFTVPYSIPYAEWKPEKVYDKVVVKGYRLHPPSKMPRMIGDLMRECLGDPDQRPPFKTVLVCLRNFIKEGDKERGLGIF